MSALFGLPAYFWRQKFIRGGRRLPKLPDIQAKHYENGYDRQRLPVHYTPLTGIGRILPPMSPGTGLVMIEHEYQFWRKYMSTDMTQCRACGACFSLGSEFRKGHLEQQGCAKEITAALKLLRRDRKCVVCDKHTEEERWAVPLCVPCRETWRFQVHQPVALGNALTLVRRQVFMDRAKAAANS